MFLEIDAQAFNTCSLEQIVENKLKFKREPSYDSHKPSRNYDFEKYERRRSACMKTLIKKHDELPKK